MNNPKDNLKDKESSFASGATSAADFCNPENQQTSILVDAEAASKDQLSKLVPNKGGTLGASKILDNKALINNSAYQRALPSIMQTIIGLTICLLLTLCLSMLNYNGLFDYWVALPFQVYWSYWLFTLNRAFAKRYKGDAPLTLVELILVCALHYIFLPLVTNYNLSRLLDPFFYLWLATLAYAPIKCGKFIDEKAPEKQKERIGAKLGYWSVALAGAAALMLLILPSTINQAFVYGFCWFLSQTAWITYSALSLSGKLNANEGLAVNQENKVYDGTNITIRYHAYPELERWFKQRFKARGVAKGTRLLLMWFGGPTLVIFGVLLISTWLPLSFPGAGTQSPEVNSAMAQANINFIFQFIIFLVLCAVLALVAFFIRPTHLGLGEKGIRFLWRRRLFSKNGNYSQWSKITSIYIEQKSNQAAAKTARLCFRDDKNYINKIPLNALDSYEDKQLLLNAIRTWAPTISRDARVIESLQPPSDYSYTELWLQALSAPPKRERFKPLINDAVLKNDRYKVLGSLGTGGQGFAYLVEDCSNHQEVVLKEFILPVYVDISIRKSALKQFENEARILSQLTHPQIVRLLDFFVEDHRAYLVLEHIDGSSMRNIVDNNGPLNTENTIALANQMCDILSYLHRQVPPVVHRDFTPDNLILSKYGTLKLIDFNVAQNTESTTTGTVVGKPAYLPPEQFRGAPTTQSDIYAMGATLYFLLTGSDPMPISISHPIEHNSQITASLDDLVARATELDLAKRYPDIVALKDDLASIK